MKSTELRLGNLIDAMFAQFLTGINQEWRPITIGAIREDSITTAVGESIDWDDKYLRPIPLTEEWLFKFGFDKNGVNYSIQGMPIWEHVTTKELHYRIYDTSKDKAIVLEHVHQLQNLYFSLTNEELAIKEL